MENFKKDIKIQFIKLSHKIIHLNKVSLVCAVLGLLTDGLDAHEELFKIHVITLNIYLLQLDKILQEK